MRYSSICASVRSRQALTPAGTSSDRANWRMRAMLSSDSTPSNSDEEPLAQPVLVRAVPLEEVGRELAPLVAGQEHHHLGGHGPRVGRLGGPGVEAEGQVLPFEHLRGVEEAARRVSPCRQSSRRGRRRSTGRGAGRWPGPGSGRCPWPAPPGRSAGGSWSASAAPSRPSCWTGRPRRCPSPGSACRSAGWGRRPPGPS